MTDVDPSQQTQLTVSMNQSEVETKTCNQCQARKKQTNMHLVPSVGKGVPDEERAKTYNRSQARKKHVTDAKRVKICNQCHAR